MHIVLLLLQIDNNHICQPHMPAAVIYTHEVVIHERNFIDPEDPMIHTQTVEGIWMRAKRKIRQQLGTSEALFPSYIHEFVWRNKYKHHILANLFICISEQYPLS